MVYQLFFLLLTVYLGAEIPTIETPAGACWKEIQMIDHQVEKLNQEKQKHIERSRNYQKEGDNWLYISGSIQDGYRNWALADEERKKAVALQEQIDLLLERKSRIYQYYPEFEVP